MSVKMYIGNKYRENEYFLNLLFLFFGFEFAAFVANKTQSVSFMVFSLFLFVFFLHRITHKQIKKLGIGRERLMLFMVVYSPILMVFNYLGQLLYVLSESSLLFGEESGSFDFISLFMTLQEDNPFYYYLLLSSMVLVITALVVSIFLQLYMTFKSPQTEKPKVR